MITTVVEIDARLQQDGLLLGRMALSHLLLMRDANYPWLVLVPDRQGVREIYALSVADQQQLWCESSYLAERMAVEFQADKMNVAALGNVVAQLHLHHIVRYRDDVAWPAPVWGKVPAKPYTATELAVMVARVKRALGDRVEWLL